MVIPIIGITIQCQGWKASVLSFGRTSQPQVSQQIAAICLRWIHSAVSKRSPGASPAAYVPQSPRVVPVPHFLAVEDVAQPVPLRPALQRHGDHVVGITKFPRFLPPRHRIGTGRQHGVYRIEAPSPPPAFGTLLFY